MALSPRGVDFLRLLLRSPGANEGWRNASAATWPLVTKFEAQELIEAEPLESGGRVRLSELGLEVIKYII